MRSLLKCLFLFTVAMNLVGCGDGKVLLITKGQVVDNGEPVVPDDDQTLQVGFIPISPDGKPARNWYVADVDADTGRFASTGPFKKGLPPGKYRVAVELIKKKKDLYRDRFNGADSPFVVDVKSTSKLIVLDVATSTASLE